MGRANLLTIDDLTLQDVETIFELSREMKDQLKKGQPHRRLEGKVLAMYFEKPSLRTRSTFEIGIYQLGGHGLLLESGSVGLGVRESIHDVAKNLERWVDLIMIRTFGQNIVEELARHAACPVINALTDEAHPCQALADLFTVIEHRGALEGLSMAFVGDGNNICASLARLCSLLGVHFRHTGPRDHQLPAAVLERARSNRPSDNTIVEYVEDPAGAVAKSDLVYTDVWASMGQEDEAAARKKIFDPYQVNAALMAHAPEGALVMHDLPAHRGEEITDEVIDSPASIVFAQAENRLHIQKGIMVHLDRQNKAN
jgi:ornithine carbamoyltransferase